MLNYIVDADLSQRFFGFSREKRISVPPIEIKILIINICKKMGERGEERNA